MGKLKIFTKDLARDLGAIIENLPDGVYITDKNANTLMINRAYERITGIKRAEVVGRNMRDLVKSGAIDRSVSLEVIEKKESITLMQELRSGKKILVTGNPLFDEKDEIALVVTSVRDITELVDLKDKLHERTLEINRYIAELDHLKTLRGQQKTFITKNKKVLEIMDVAVTAAKFDSSILITGESGVGKGLMARLIHESSDRRARPFIVINCAGIPEDLFESELFGYEPGAFSGASEKGKKGLLEVGDRGTVFLDEIGDMSLRLQAKLLRTIEEKEITRLGSTKMVKLNIRFLSATNQDLPVLIEQKKFRQDLFFRMNTILLSIPPLRERHEDIIPLVNHFTDLLNKRYKMEKKFHPQAAQFLVMYKFPGNARELSNIVEQAFLISKGNNIRVEDLPLHVRGIIDSKDLIIDSENKSYSEIIDLMEHKVLKRALEKYGSTHKAAKNLKINQSTIVRKMKRLRMTVGDDAWHRP